MTEERQPDQIDRIIQEQVNVVLKDILTPSGDNTVPMVRSNWLRDALDELSDTSLLALLMCCQLMSTANNTAGRDLEIMYAIIHEMVRDRLPKEATSDTAQHCIQHMTDAFKDRFTETVSIEKLQQEVEGSTDAQDNQHQTE